MSLMATSAFGLVTPLTFKVDSFKTCPAAGFPMCKVKVLILTFSMVFVGTVVIPDATMGVTSKTFSSTSVTIPRCFDPDTTAPPAKTRSPAITPNQIEFLAVLSLIFLYFFSPCFIYLPSAFGNNNKSPNQKNSQRPHPQFPRKLIHYRRSYFTSILINNLRV